MDAKLGSITLTRANEIVKSHHHRTTSLGCWESNNKPHHRGYAHVAVTAGGKPFTACLHQLALIAHNRRDELKLTLGSISFDISHLCHNRRCFNAEHLVVESRQTNKVRQTCNGHKILVHDEFSYHPCSHGSDEKMRKCILPVERLHDAMPTGEEDDEQTSTEAPATDQDDTATGNNDAGKLDQITPRIAQELINKYRVTISDLGCWVSTLKPDTMGYCRAKLRKLQCRPFLHQLALIADNRAVELETTLGSNSFDVSHLCHNSKCFNPGHLIVESRQNNLRRRTCVGHKVVLYGSFECHPCRHGEVEKMRKCILPLLRLGAGHHVNGSV
ncbi:zinc-binding loop region of homing endonuclease-domain-containing protein [Lipomyces starkeyi]